MNYGGDCRTAPATPGLLISIISIHYMSYHFHLPLNQDMNNKDHIGDYGNMQNGFYLDALLPLETAH